MKRFRKALGIVVLALVVSLSLAMPVSAWADEAESYGKPTVSGPQSAWYNGQSHHFRSTVKDSVSGEDLVRGRISLDPSALSATVVTRMASIPGLQPMTAL